VGGGQFCGVEEVADIVFENVSFVEPTSTISDFDIDVVGSNTFPLMLRDSRLTGAMDLVHIAGGASINLDNDDLEPPSAFYPGTPITANGSIRLDSEVQHMTISNCYTESPGPNFLYQGYVQETDGINVVRLINNTINANAPIVFVPNQMMVLDGNTIKGNVVINAGGPGYGKQNVMAVGNQFGGTAGFVGTAQGQIQQLGTAYPSGAVSSVLSSLWLSGPTTVGGVFQFSNNGGQVAYRVSTSSNQGIPQDWSPLHVDEVRTPTMIQAGQWTIDTAGAAPGARIRLVKSSTDNGYNYPVNIAQYDSDTGTTTAITPPGGAAGSSLQINSTHGAIGWVEVVLVSGSPNSWAVSAWGTIP
jgi:hypothetical protein